MLDAKAILADARSKVNFDPADLVRELEAYGEAEAARRLPQLNAEAIEAIGVLAAAHYGDPARPILDKAICLGVVEFLEGSVRPLKRSRRVYAKRENAGEA